jgi:predicted nucleotidyltransferase
MGSFGRFVAARREILGLSQRDLARASGVKQPLISAIESGRRTATSAAQEALSAALRVRPSKALEHYRTQVVDLVYANKGVHVFLFGSVALGADDSDSDLDLLVEFAPDADIVDLLSLEEELAELLTVPVDVISAGSSSALALKARSEAVAYA